MDINTQIISNQLDNSNKFCIDWNQLGCIAFASGSIISIIDSNHMKIIHTINSNYGQKNSVITKLKWSQVDLNNIINSYPVLASASDDVISIWNPNLGILIHELIPNDSQFLSNSNNKLNDMKWLNNSPTVIKSNSCSILVSLYSNSKLILWNAQNATKLWSKTFNESSLNNFAIDPHDFLRVAFLGSNFIQFVKFDYQNDQFQDKSVRKFFLMSNEATTDSGIVTNQVTLDPNARKSTINIFTNYWKNIKPLDTKLTQHQKPSSNECFQIEFHSFVKNLLYLTYSKEIFIFDLTINQTIGFIQLDKMHSPFLQIYSCSQADVLYSLHESGSITVHSRYDSNFQYCLIAQSDQIRLSKNANVYGFSICPNTQKNISILLSDGRVLKYELFQKKKQKNVSVESLFLFELFSDSNLNQRNIFKLMLTSMLNSMPAGPFVIKIGPTLTKKNCKVWQPLLAIGDSNGFLFIYNLNKNKLVKKLLLFTHPVTGIEWSSLNSVVAWSYITTNSMSNLSILDANQITPTSQNRVQLLVKNELLYTDLRTGESVNFRVGVNEESPISSVKISNLRQYLVVLFKDQPLEIWDIKNFTLIKKISKKSPVISVLEWCPHDFNKKTDPVLAPLNKTDSDQSEANLEAAKNAEFKADKEHHPLTDTKECFICIDLNGLMYSFAVEQNHINSIAIPLPEDGILVNITCMAMKKDLILFGDSDGNLTKWNIKTKSSKSISLKRGMELKKCKFAPGKENLLLLVQCVDTLQIFEVNNLEMFSEFKTNSSPKTKIIDSYWCSSDKILVYFSDLSIKVFNVSFKQPVDSNNLLAPYLYKPFDPSNKVETNLVKFKSQLIDLIDSSNLNKNVLKDFVNTQVHLSDNLADLLINKFDQTFKNKIDKFASLNAYFSLNSFETKFWSLFSYLLFKPENSNTENKFRFVLKQNPFLSNSNEFRSNELESLKFYKEKFDNQQQINSLLKDLLLFNQLELVFNLLMETESSNENYTNNLIKACLISTLKNSNDISQAQTSIKLVATNLIANGKLYDGIEMLSLIGLVFDACRYLQDNNEWEKAAWLAKIRLNEEEVNDVIKRWCENLCSNQLNRKELAILLLLSCKVYWKVLSILSDTAYIQLTYLFMKYLIQNNLISLCDNEKFNGEEDGESFLNLIDSSLDKMTNEQQQATVKKILKNYLEFKKLLSS